MGRQGGKGTRNIFSLSPPSPLSPRLPSAALPSSLSSFPLCVSARMRRFVFIPFRVNYNAPGFASLPACKAWEKAYLSESAISEVASLASRDYR